MKITSAVIFAAGFGSRMLPVTSAIQKEMLPVLDRPIIDYLVEDCLRAGITTFYFVIRPGSHALQDFYIGNAGLQEYLQHYGKTAAIEKLAKIHGQATYNFVEQPVDAGYGTAIPLMVAAKHLPSDEAVIVCTGDQFFWREDGGSDMADLVEAYHQSGAEGALQVNAVPEEEVHKYGIIDMFARDGQNYLRRIVEKPQGQAPSNLNNSSRYIFSPKMLEYVHKVKPHPQLHESLVTDAIGDAAQNHSVLVHETKGRYLDCGSVQGWLEANMIVARSRPELADKLPIYNL